MEELPKPSDAYARWAKVNNLYAPDPDNKRVRCRKKPTPKKGLLPPLIKDDYLFFIRYKNRKIYSLDDGCYVNMTFILHCIKLGWKIKMTDQISSADITLKMILRAYFIFWSHKNMKDLDDAFRLIRENYQPR